MGEYMHAGEVHPRKEWRSRVGLLGDEVLAGFCGFVVNGFHPLYGQRSGVFDLAVRIRVDDAARVVALQEIGIIAEPVWAFGFFFRVEMIEIAEEFIEAVIGGQEFVFISKVILAELTRRVTKRLEGLRNRYVPCLQ